MVTKTCASCKGRYDDDNASPFVTCQACRRPLPEIGGCTHYSVAGASANPRVTTNNEIRIRIGDTY